MPRPSILMLILRLRPGDFTLLAGMEWCKGWSSSHPAFERRNGLAPRWGRKKKSLKCLATEYCSLQPCDKTVRHRQMGSFASCHIAVLKMRALSALSVWKLLLVRSWTEFMNFSKWNPLKRLSASPRNAQRRCFNITSRDRRCIIPSEKVKILQQNRATEISRKTKCFELQRVTLLVAWRKLAE